MLLILAIIYAITAGIINGSFAWPTKKTKRWQFEHIWLNYSIWAFFIIPWVTIFLFAPNVKLVYEQIDSFQLLLLIIGGLLFGIGQICFAQALRLIGLGLAFVLNIGLGTSLGFLAPLLILHPEKTLSLFGLATFIGCALIIIGLILSYIAGKKRDQIKKPHLHPHISKHNYHIGVVLAIIAGFFSALQNFVFSATFNLQTVALNTGLNQLPASIIIWPIFLSFSLVPYFFYMLYLHHKNKSFHIYWHPLSVINIPISFIMALFWFGSLVLYSKSSLQIGELGPVVAWPLFMVWIILTSNFWGWREKEWEHCPASVNKMMHKAIALLILAVVILAYSVTLS